MNAHEATSHHNEPTHAGSSFPILMRLPDLRSLAPTMPTSKPVPPATTEPLSSLEPPAANNSSPIQSSPEAAEPSPTTVAELKTASTPGSSDAPQPATSVANLQAQRRQRALERQRRHNEAEPKKTTWWTSHVPVILFGFVCALILTVYLARMNRPTQPHTDEWATHTLPEMKIETGAPAVMPSSISSDSAPALSLAKQPETIAPPTTSLLNDEVKKVETLKTPSLLTSPASTAATEKPAEKTPTVASDATGSPLDNGFIPTQYPNTNQPALQPVSKVANVPEDAGTTSPQYPTTNYPAIWR
jgi:hypothetical protein